VIIDLEVTSVCNAACSFCPRDALSRTARFIDPATITRLAAEVRRQDTPVQISICGIGEPTLYPDLADSIAVLSEAGGRVCLVSNGSTLEPRQLAEFVRAGLAELNISLNAATPATRERLMQMDDFATTTHALRDVLARKSEIPGDLDINVSFVLCTENEHELLSFVQQWKSTPVSHILIHPLNNRGSLLGEAHSAGFRARAMAELEGEPKVQIDLFAGFPDDGRLCKILYLIDFISVDGELLLCAMDYRRRFSFGNIRDHSLADLRKRKIRAFAAHQTGALCDRCDFSPTPKN